MCQLALEAPRIFQLLTAESWNPNPNDYQDLYSYFNTHPVDEFVQSLPSERRRVAEGRIDLTLDWFVATNAGENVALSEGAAGPAAAPASELSSGSKLRTLPRSSKVVLTQAVVDAVLVWLEAIQPMSSTARNAIAPLIVSITQGLPDLPK